MPVSHKAVDRLSDLLRRDGTVTYSTRIDAREAAYLSPMLDRIIADDEDGDALRMFLIRSIQSERPPIDIYRGDTSTCRIDGPWQEVDRYWLPLGGLVLMGAMTLPCVVAGRDAIVATETYYWAEAKLWFTSAWARDAEVDVHIGDQVLLRRSARQIIAHPYFRRRTRQVWAWAQWGSALGFVGWLGVLLARRGVTLRRRERLLADRWIAGTAMTTEKRLAKFTRKDAGAVPLSIGTVPFPARLETRHMAMIGTTGSGKTTALRQLLDGIEARGEAALVYDTSGEFIAHYYRPARGDIILNPFDARCAFWSPFAEIAHPADADRIAHQLITETGQHDSDVWLDTSRILVANMIRALWREGKCSLADLLHALQNRTKDDLKEWLATSSSARSYYEADDYYSEGGLSPSQWHGKGAEVLGLSGEVDRDQFRELLDGQIAGQQLGTFRGGQLEHRPGWDITLSVPKSVSVMAEVAGDRRLIAAHSEAAATAMAHVEQHMAATRIREGSTVSREATGNLVIASFQHGTSRAQDPQLHTHNVVMNATQGEDGAWRSLEPRAIAASGVNPLDIKIHAGQAAHARHPLPAILGLDMAGTVDALGVGVTRFQRGDEVYGMTGGVGGVQGTLADYAVVDADLLAIKPANLSMREAAALPLITITAWEGIVDRMGVAPGDTVLVQGGAGGVGHVAVQIALARGARVFATGSASQQGLIEALGATFIDRNEPVADYVARLTDGEGFDRVYDTAGGVALDASFQAVRRFGHVASCLGWGTHGLAPLSFKGASYSGVFTLMPLLSGVGRRHHGEILQAATQLAEAGKLLPRLNPRRFTLNDVCEAYRTQKMDGALGKIVVDMAD